MITPNLEKAFIVYVLKNPQWFPSVKPNFFKHPELKQVYSTIYRYMQSDFTKPSPKPKQVAEMVFSEDIDKKITTQFLKSVFETKLENYDEKNYIIPQMTQWVRVNNIKEGTDLIIDKTRELDSTTDLNGVLNIGDDIKELVEKYTTKDLDHLTGDTEDLGSDFDDPDCHDQDLNTTKIDTGYDTLNKALGGGWDAGSLINLIAETNQGKSLWMQNFAVNSANTGKTVVYFTLEMTEKKTMKRFGAMRLDIPINDYDRVASDREFIRKKIDDLKYKLRDSGDVFAEREVEVGKIITKYFPAGAATVRDLEDYLIKLNAKKGIKPELIIIDYLTLLTTPKGVDSNNLYQKGKYLAEAVRALAAKYECPVITATQVAKTAWGLDDISLNQIPESKAIAETCDNIIAIIRTEEMRRDYKYRLKMLKQRDGEFMFNQIRFDLNPLYLRIENDIPVELLM